ncbi:MAG: hypothetical protein PHF37_02355 [Phycisphaerae bacterium]|nr:hypothetical protein [Phycisphaerae bacterium]
MPEEQVLVIERSVYEQAGQFHGLTFDVEHYKNAIFAAGVPRFIPRSQAESNPGFKQIIPYVIMACEGKILSYIRGKRAGETRLVAKRSIGIGGHINPTDDMPLFNSDFYDTYLAAVQREVNEEVTIESPYRNQLVALLNDDSNEVGQVHLGIVHLWQLDSPQVSRREQMITQMEFLPRQQLESLREQMETWSQLCFDALPSITGR